MRIWAISDLHLANFTIGQPPSPSAFPVADVCVVAGDVSDDLEKSVAWLAENFAVAMPVIYVAGNHDFYDYPLPARSRLRERFRAYEPLVYVLDREIVEIGGTRFAGTTFWSDLDLYAFGDLEKLSLTQEAVQANVADCAWIQLEEVRKPRLITAADIISLHKRDREWLAGVLSTPFPGPTVVVTHHAPHHNSIAPQYAGLLDTASYASDQTALIEAYKPDMWIHGHTHLSCSYQVGSTRILSNQLGRDGEESGFKLHQVVTLRGSPALLPERGLAHQN